MGQFDQTARPLAKLDGAAFFSWAFSCCAPVPRLTFLDWDDCARLVCPGEPDRTNDLVALFRDDDHPRRPTWLVAEIEAEPESGIFYRMGQYEFLLGKEVNPACDPLGPAVGSLLLNLSGTQKTAKLEWAWGGYGTRVAPFIVDVAAQSADATLDRIERGELGLTLSPLLALMIGGGTLEFIKRWKRVVSERAMDEATCRMLRDSAQILAELTPWQVNWLGETRDWMARESQLIKSWMKEGGDIAELRTKRAALLKVIKRLENPVPESIRLAIEGTNDLDKLDGWHEAALDAAINAQTLAQLRTVMKLES